MSSISIWRSQKQKNFKVEERNAIVLEMAIKEEINTFLVKYSTTSTKKKGKGLLKCQAWIKIFI